MAGIAKVVRAFRQVASAFGEKTDTVVDECDTEHFLLYHGLVGSTPENQPEYKDVRSDIREAVSRRSSSELAVALKLPPILWEQRLKKIFDEMDASDREWAVRCLLAQEHAAGIDLEQDPLRHPDWRVRANAGKLLAHLGANQSISRIAEALFDCRQSHRPAFCHLAYALAAFGTSEAETALAGYVGDAEAWFRVDAAGAISLCGAGRTEELVSEALLKETLLKDYMAAAVYANCGVPRLLGDSRNTGEVRAEAAMELVLGLIDAVEGPFHSESGIASALEECRNLVNIACATQPSPRRLRAANALNEWRSRSSPGRERSAAPDSLSINVLDPAHRACVEDWIRRGRWADACEIGQLRHALHLCGVYSIDVSDCLMDYLSSDFPLLDEVIETLGLLGAESAGPLIVNLAKSCLDVDSRASRQLSLHPVVEADPRSATTYWRALRALGGIPHHESARLLFISVSDYAPDKREQALESLQRICMQDSMREEYKERLSEVVAVRLEDPATPVKLVALRAVAQHGMGRHAPAAIKLLGAAEVSIQNQARRTLLELGRSACKEEVRQLLQQAQERETDRHKRDRLSGVLKELVG